MTVLRHRMDSAFDVAYLEGGVVEELLGFSEHAQFPAVDIVFLKVAGLPWQRFFLECGVGFWEEYVEKEAFEDHLYTPRIDYGSRFGVVGQRIRRVGCVADRPDRATRIVIELDSGCVELKILDATVSDPDAMLVFVERRES